MAKHQFSLFATKNDMLEVLHDVMSKTTYAFSYLDKDNVVKVFDSAEQIEDFGIMLVGDKNQARTYLLVRPDKKPTVRTVEQRGGGIKICYDQKSNPESVSCRVGGVLAGSSCIIAGQVGTVSEHLWSVALYKTIFASVKKRCSKIKSFYVGDKACEKLDQGYRLTTNVKAPIDYDLKR